MFSDLGRFVQTVCSSGYPPSDNHVWTTVGVVNERDNRCNMQLPFIAHTALTHASVNALLCKLVFECCTFKYSSSFSLQVVFLSLWLAITSDLPVRNDILPTIFVVSVKSKFVWHVVSNRCSFSRRYHIFWLQVTASWICRRSFWYSPFYIAAQSMDAIESCVKHFDIVILLLLFQL